MLLKSASQLWRRASIEEEAQKIKNCGDSIYEAACLFIQKYAELGRKIEQLETAYNDAAGTLNGNLIPKGRGMGKLSAMGITKKSKRLINSEKASSHSVRRKQKSYLLLLHRN